MCVFHKRPGNHWHEGTYTRACAHSHIQIPSVTLLISCEVGGRWGMDLHILKTATLIKGLEFGALSGISLEALQRAA